MPPALGLPNIAAQYRQDRAEEAREAARARKRFQLVKQQLRRLLLEARRGTGEPDP